jgi:hypothetical protein
LSNFGENNIIVGETLVIFATLLQFFSTTFPGICFGTITTGATSEERKSSPCTSYYQGDQKLGFGTPGQMLGSI